MESVWDYPRPPRVLETSHPPAYYIPSDDVRMEYLRPNGRRTFCEFKGRASYYDLVVGDRLVRGAAWSYADPAPGYEAIRDHVAFYAGRVDACYLDDELVAAQAGEFYGGWVTADIDGPFKGAPGTAGW